MKKISIVLFLSMIAFCFFSCGTTQEASVEQPAPEEAVPETISEPAPAPAPAPAPEPVAAEIKEETKKALDEFPTGKWLDANWNAVWEFGINKKIRILDSETGKVVYDFEGKISDFEINPAGLGLALSFKCHAAKREYVFTKEITGTDLQMSIVRKWTPESYIISMPFQN